MSGLKHWRDSDIPTRQTAFRRAPDSTRHHVLDYWYFFDGYPLDWPLHELKNCAPYVLLSTISTQRRLMAFVGADDIL